MVQSRRSFLTTLGMGVAAAALPTRGRGVSARRPNIVMALADDWSWPHATLLGTAGLRTPAFDHLASQGVLFENAFCAAPSCTPSRAALLTGQWPWRLEQGANLWGTLPSKFDVYPDILQRCGYHVGFSGKGWGPGLSRPGGRQRNPAGPKYHNFTHFLQNRQPNQPFCFWLGSHNPHRPYQGGAGERAGIDLARLELPYCLPDGPGVRRDFGDYLFEIERFDKQLSALFAMLSMAGELENTLLLVSSDNGMPFPRCKSNLYDLGTHVPLAAYWKGTLRPGGRVSDFVSLCDIAPTIIELAGVQPPSTMSGRSLTGLLQSPQQGGVSTGRDRVIFGKERHIAAQNGSMGGYPMRGVRTAEYLYIRNFQPQRWPAGTPLSYRDVDSSPTKAFMLQQAQQGAGGTLFELAFGKRPAEELYHLSSDPGQLRNVAAQRGYGEIVARLRGALERELHHSGDPRIKGEGERFERYPYYMLKRLHA